jgi:CO/xanthine dehydrogenase Mo-binding subunit
VIATNFKYIGRSYPASDAARKATGELVYGSDLCRPGMLYAALVLSPHAHAVVSAVDATRALSVAGVVGVYSHRNSPLTRYCRYRISPRQRGCIDDEALFTATARFAGDRVAAVVAMSRAVAREAAQLVDVAYTVLPPVLDADAALAPGAPPVHPRGNLVYEFDHAAGEADASPADAVTSRTTVRTQMLHHAALEPHLCLADFDASGKLTIWSPCQSVYGARTVVADLLGLPCSRVRVVKVPMGGSFGGKQEFILEPVTAFLAMQTRRPVSLVLDRAECIRATMVRGSQRSIVSSMVSADGVLLELDVETLLAAGAYASSSPGYAEAMAHKLTRLYRVRRYRHRGRVAYTNTPVAGGMRGWGAPDIATCAEIHLDQVARQLRMDPVALRLKNLVLPGDTDPVSGRSVGDARVRQCLELGALAFRWQERIALPAGSGRTRKAVGVACGAHKNGVLGEEFPELSTMTLKMNEDGSLNLNASIHEVGAGSAVTMKLIIAEELDVPPELISAGEADSETSPFDFGCFGSRMTYVCGASARALAITLRENLVAAAAELLQTPRKSLEACGGRVRFTGSVDTGLPYREIVQGCRMRLGRDISVTQTYRGKSNPGAYSVQFAEVEVDVLTGLTRVTDFLTVVDIGRAINRSMVEGQCRGAVQAGIGSALCEEVVLDAEGRMSTRGFKDYHLVNAVDMPPVKVLLVEHDGDDGPYGAKSVGEIAVVPTAAAIVNAVNRALGTAMTTLPLTPERIVAALAAAPEPVERCAPCS